MKVTQWSWDVSLYLYNKVFMRVGDGGGKKCHKGYTEYLKESGKFQFNEDG